MTTTKLDRIIDGIRYRSSTRISPQPGRGQYVHGVRDVALWVCRNVIVLERDSQWDDGTGACRGTTYQVIDPRDDRYTESGIGGAEARGMLQGFADNWRGYVDGDQDPEEVLRSWANRHAPAETAIPLCAATMGCLCAGHARGNSADAPCDTRENVATV